MSSSINLSAIMAAAQAAAQTTSATPVQAPVIQSRDAEALEVRGKSGADERTKSIAEQMLKQVRQNESFTGRVLDQNKYAAEIATKMVAGDIVVKQVTKRVQPVLPFMVRGYADSEIGQYVIANVIALALKQFRPGNLKAEYVAEAVMMSAGTELAKSFNIEGMIDELLSSITMPVAAAQAAE